MQKYHCWIQYCSETIQLEIFAPSWLYLEDVKYDKNKKSIGVIWVGVPQLCVLNTQCYWKVTKSLRGGFDEALRSLEMCPWTVVWDVSLFSLVSGPCCVHSVLLGVFCHDTLPNHSSKINGTNYGLSLWAKRHLFFELRFSGVLLEN